MLLFLFQCIHPLQAGEDLEDDEDEDKEDDEELGEGREADELPSAGLSERTPLVGGITRSRSRSRRRRMSVDGHGNATVTQAVLMVSTQKLRSRNGFISYPSF